MYNSYHNLRDQIDKSFDLSDFKGLCFDLGVDVDNLAGEDKKVVKIQALISHLNARHKLPILVNRLYELRPHVNWRELDSKSSFVSSNPYKGLYAFREEDAANFFGRETYVEQLITAVHFQDFVAVIGPSGSGKSSIVMAGLIPILRQENWEIITLRPGNRPFFNLLTKLFEWASLGPSLNFANQIEETKNLASAMEREENPISLGEILSGLLSKFDGKKQLLLVIDQFEELYTAFPKASLQHRFSETLLSIDKTAPVKILLTLRADFLGQALEYRPLADALQGHDIKLGSMKIDELYRAICYPAQYAHIHFETGLDERILNDISDEPGYLPLLQFALTQLWEYQTEGQLTHEAYGKIGRVEGALANYADNIFASLNSDQKEQARHIFTQLIQPNNGAEDTRRLALRKDFTEEHWELVRMLADKRLVVTNRDADERETVEVAHEALIRNWKLLQEWMENDRAFRVWQERLRSSHIQWEFNGRDAGGLLRGAILNEAENWYHERNSELSRNDKEYIEASIDYQHRLDHSEAQRKLKDELQKQRSKRQTQVLGVALIVVAILGIATFLIGRSLRNEQVAKQETNSLRLAVASQDNLDTNYELALLLAIEAAQQAQLFAGDENWPLEVSTALRRVLLYRGQSIALLTAHTEKIRQIIWSPDKLYFLTTGTKELNVWNAKTLQLTKSVITPQNIQHVAWNPDNRHFAIATLGELNTVEIWSLTSNQPILQLDSNTTVSYLAWNHEGNLLATAGQNGKVIIWDIRDDLATPVTILEHQSSVQFVAWNREDSLLLTISGLKTYLWLIDPAKGTHLLTLENKGRLVESAYWSPDEKHIMTIDNKVNGIDENNFVYIWDAQTGGKVKELFHQTKITDAQWSQDGTHILTSGEDGWIRIWDATKGEIEIQLIGHETSINNILWNQNEQQILSTYQDGTLAVWDVNRGQQITTLTGHSASVNEASWNATETQIVSVSDDTTIRVWNPVQGAEVANLIGHNGEINDVEWNSNGSKVVTASEDRTAIIWDGTTGKLLFTLGPHEDPVRQAVWSPNGEYIITVSNESMVRVWDANNGTLLQLIDRHQIRVNHAAWHKIDSELFFVTASDDRTAKMWSFPSSRHAILQHIFEMDGPVSQAIWSPSGIQIATAAFNRYGTPLQIWDSITGEEVNLLDTYSTNISYIDWNSDGTKLVTANDDFTAVVWNILTGSIITRFSEHSGAVNQASWQPGNTGTGSLIVTASEDGRAIVWESTTGVPTHYLVGHQNRVNQANWDPDGNFIVTASDDRTARIWAVNSGEQIALLEGHTDFVNQAVWDPTGQRIITVSADHTARIYYVLSVDLLKLACQRAVRNMTQAEWDVFMQDQPYEATCPNKPTLNETR